MVLKEVKEKGLIFLKVMFCANVLEEAPGYFFPIFSNQPLPFFLPKWKIFFFKENFLQSAFILIKKDSKDIANW